ncbi:hypothetical protein HKCCE2091_08170 [Rhodobacterales bacterium HKCCE2091]|nr:hypothetical protein [Rhodobacterales bacterium HKCCE2091]
MSERVRPGFLPLAALSVAAITAGLLLGRAAEPPTESEVISDIAERYVSETGGAHTDCVARPGPAGLAWLTVYCEGEAGDFAYPVDRDGRVVPIEEDGA